MVDDRDAGTGRFSFDVAARRSRSKDHTSSRSSATADVRILDAVEPTSVPITAAQVPGLLLQALPSLRDKWPEIEAENADAEGAGGRLGYLDASWLIGILADRLVTGDTSELDAAFDLIELLISNGDEYVSELGVIGYIEGLQMQTVTSRGVDPESFRPWLRPLSTEYWEAVDRFWADGTPIPKIERTDADDQPPPLRQGDVVTVERLTLVSQVGWIELVEPAFVRAGERFRVDRDAQTVTVECLDGTERVHESKPSGPDSVP